jgi:hypothetical protein
MMLLYTFLMFVLGAVKHMVTMRARALERKYVRIAAAVDQLLRDANLKPGNKSMPDLCAYAKQTVLLGQLAQKRDRIEAKYFAWQRWADRVGGWVQTVTNWKGMKLPYTLGAVDVWMLLHLIDYLGVGQYVSFSAMIEAIVSLCTN